MIVQISVLCQGEVGREVDFYLSLLAGVFCSHNNYAVGGARTIDGGGGSILQHVDGLDVVDIQVGQLTFHGQTIDNEQRRGLCVERAGTTDFQLTSVG